MKTESRLLLGTCVLALISGAGSAVAQDVTVLDPVSVTNDAGSAEPDAISILSEELETIEPTDLRDVFSRQAAVQVGGGSPASQKFYVHGLGESQLRVTVDGVPQPGNIWHHNSTLSIDPALLKSVEVQPGVTAADAGFGAAAGAVNFELVKPSDLLEPGETFGGTVNAQYGSNGDAAQGTLTFFGQNGGFDYLAAISRGIGDNYESGDGEEQRGTEENMTSVLLKLGIEGTAGHRLEFSTEYIEDDAERLLRPNMDLVRGDYLYNDNKATRQTTTLRYVNTNPTAVFDPDVLFYINDTTLERPNGDYGRASGDFNADTSTFGGKVENTFTLKSGTITTGVDFYQSDLKVERFYFPDDRYAKEEVTGYGLYAQGRFALTDWLDISTGARADAQTFDAVDGQSFDNSGVSVNATLTAAFGGGFGGFVGANRTFLGLEQSELALYHANDYTYDSDIDPAWSENYLIGLTYEVGGFSGVVSFFDTTIHDGLGYDYTTLTRVNAADLQSKGWDAALNYGWATGQAGLRVSNADVSYDGGTVLSGELDAEAVGTMATLYIDQEVERYNIVVGGSVQYAGKVDEKDFVEAFGQEIDPYTVVDVYVAWTPPQVEALNLRFGISNLFDENYASRTSYPTRISGSDVIVSPVEAPGRSFEISANYRF